MSVAVSGGVFGATSTSGRVRRRPADFHPLGTVREQVTVRLDGSYAFELYTICGLKKMRLGSGLALIILLVMALDRIQANPPGQCEV